MNSEFLVVSGVSVNADRIDYVDFRQAGNATIHIGSNSVTTSDGDEIATLRELFVPEAETDPVEVLAEQTAEHEGKPGINVGVPRPQPVE